MPDRTQIDLEIDAIESKIKTDGGCMLWIHFDNEDVNIRRGGNTALLARVLAQAMQHDGRLAQILMYALAEAQE